MSSIADNFTEKFLIDVEKFTVWIVDNPNYKITHSDNGENFNNNSLIELFKDFKEPGRYKMDFFIKHISQKFPIYINNKKIESHDIKPMVDDFKNNKPKRVPKIFKKSEPTTLIEKIVSEPTTIPEPTILIEPTTIPEPEPTTLIEPITIPEPTTIPEPKTLIEPIIVSEPKTLIENKIANMPTEYDFLINKNFIVNLEDIVFDII